jgi:hypothetical protein
MKEETEEKLLGMLEWVEGVTKSGGEFLSEQTPLYIQELLHYHFWTSAVIWGFAGLTLIPIIFGVMKVKKMFDDNEEDYRVIWFLVFIVYLITTPPTLYHNSDWIKIKLAPRVYVVDYVTEKLKGE